MKKILISLFICLFMCQNALAAPKGHHAPPPPKPPHEKRHHPYDMPPPPPPEPIVLIDRTVTTSETPFPDCDRHFLYTETTTEYFSDGTHRNHYNYQVFDMYGTPIINSNYSISHLSHNNEHYFIIGGNYLVNEYDINYCEENRFQSIKLLTNNRLLVKKFGKFGIITYNKQEVLPITYKNIKEINTGVYLVKLNDAWGVYNIDGKCLLPPIYEKVSKLGNSYYKIKRNNSYGIIDIYGNVIADAKYKKVRLKNNILQVSFNGSNFQNIR